MNKWIEANATKPEDAKVLILGIPFDGGTSQEAGASEAPAKLRELGEAYMPGSTDDLYLVDEKPIIYDFGDVDMSGTWEESFGRVEEEAFRIMKYGKFNLFLGGDHSVTIPLHKAFAKAEEGKKIGIIHFDAHPDLCDCYDGHIWSHANTEKRAIDDIVNPEDLLFLGIRAAEAEEIALYKKYPDMTLITGMDVFDFGYEKCCEIMYDKFRDYDSIYFTLDIDVLDPGFAPGTGTPCSGGITPRELIKMVRFMLDKLPIRNMDIVEVAPPLDVNDITSWAAMRIIEEVLSIEDRKQKGIG